MFISYNNNKIEVPEEVLAFLKEMFNYQVEYNEESCSSITPDFEKITASICLTKWKDEKLWTLTGF